jgi:hypothetical protein
MCVRKSFYLCFLFLCCLHSFYFIVFIHMCIHCLGQLPSPSTKQNLFHPLVSNFIEEKRDNEKDIAFLLVWDKDSYTKRFLVLLPCTCVLQSTLVHLYQTSSLLPSPLPLVAFASLRLLYLLLYIKHINHIQAGSHYIAQRSLELLGSNESPASASQVAGGQGMC